MAKERRCNLWDDNRKPRRMRIGSLGCFRDASACHFAHPHEREWANAKPSHPPNHDTVVDSDSDFFYILTQSDRRDREKERRDRERDRERDRKPRSPFHSPPRRKDSTATHASSGPSPRRLTFDNGVDGGGTAKRGRSPARSISSDQPETRRKDGERRTKDLPHLRQDHAPSSSRSRSKDKETAQERSRTPLVASHTPDGSITRHLPPKPPMQPAPPPPPKLPEVPSIPSFVSIRQPSGPAEITPKGLKALSVDEQRAAWHERIDLMFASITSRRDYTKLESELAQICLLSSSSFVNNLPEVNRAHISAQKMTLELQMEVKRKEINETTQKLIGSEFWPILRVSQISDMDKTFGEAKKHVLEVRALLDDVKNSCAALFKTSASDWKQNSERPSKRRRLGEKADSTGQSMMGDAEDTTRELEAFRDKLSELDRHLIDLENEITQRDKIISDEIELHIDARLEAEDALYPSMRETTGVSQTEIEAVVDAKNKELVHAVTVTSEEIGVLAVEVAELITKVNALEARCKVLEEENYEVKNKLAQDTLNHAQSQDALVRDREIEAIAAALQAYISQVPGGQTIGDLPSAEYIIESLDSQLDGLFRDKFCATLVNIQQDVFDKVRESHNHTLNTISPKIMLLLKMVNLITTRLGKPDVESPNTG